MSLCKRKSLKFKNMKISPVTYGTNICIIHVWLCAYVCLFMCVLNLYIIVLLGDIAKGLFSDFTSCNTSSKAFNTVYVQITILS